MRHLTFWKRFVGAMMHYHRDCPLDPDEVVDEFARSNHRRLELWIFVTVYCLSTSCCNAAVCWLFVVVFEPKMKLLLAQRRANTQRHGVAWVPNPRPMTPPFKNPGSAPAAWFWGFPLLFPLFSWTPGVLWRVLEDSMMTHKCYTHVWCAINNIIKN